MIHRLFLQVNTENCRLSLLFRYPVIWKEQVVLVVGAACSSELVEGPAAKLNDRGCPRRARPSRKPLPQGVFMVTWTFRISAFRYIKEGKGSMRSSLPVGGFRLNRARLAHIFQNLHRWFKLRVFGVMIMPSPVNIFNGSPNIMHAFTVAFSILTFITNYAGVKFDIHNIGRLAALITFYRHGENPQSFEVS